MIRTEEGSFCKVLIELEKVI